MKYSLRPLAHRSMLLACLGMFAGIAIDAGQGGLTLLANLCAGPHPPGLGDLMRLHWLCLPFMHAGMVGGGLLATALAARKTQDDTRSARRFLLGPACSAWMLLGMTLGSYLLLRAGLPLDETHGVLLMPAAMMAGMAAAMLAWPWLGRLPSTARQGVRAIHHMTRRSHEQH